MFNRSLLTVCLAALTSLSASLAWAQNSRVDELKAQIRTLATANMTETGNLAQIRQQLEPLVAELSTHYAAPASAQDELPALLGSWRQLWTDGDTKIFPFIQVDRKHSYQVFFQDGHFYNVANLAIPLATPTMFLRGKYAVDVRNLNTEYVSLRARMSKLDSGEDLSQLIARVETGEQPTVTSPIGTNHPTGPIGAKGRMSHLYVDADFRVAVYYALDDQTVGLGIYDKITSVP